MASIGQQRQEVIDKKYNADLSEKTLAEREGWQSDAETAAPHVTPGGDEYQRTQKLLETHKDIPFIQRMLNPDAYPVKELEGGDRASHWMSSSRDDQGEFAWPNLRYNPETNKLEKQSVQEAVESGNILRFGSSEDETAAARRFAHGSWKSVLGIE